MASQYSKEVLKIVVAKICLTIGWHSIQSTPLDIMVDILHHYILALGRKAHNYAEHFGHTIPNLEEIGLAFRDAGIRVDDLSEYIRNVESDPFPHDVPKYPIPGESHLNFLKPGSREVLTRPVHVHEYLPPMYPEMLEEDNNSQVSSSQVSVDTSATSGVDVSVSSSPVSPKGGTFKRPGEPLEHHSAKRARLMLEEEGRPLREISSVMMTTSGFLSPAREGKLPEARTPTQTSDPSSRSSSPISSPSSYPTVPPEVKGDKKVKKVVKKPADGIKNVEKDDKDFKKKETKLKEGIKLEKPTDDTKVKKLVSMKEFAKLKALKSGAIKLSSQAGFTAGPSISGLGKIPKIGAKTVGNKSPKSIKPQIKSEKQYNIPNTTAQQQKTLSPQSEKVKDKSIVDGKVASEPDKQKLNIFKKITKVKEEKTDREVSFKDSRESSPILIIDESDIKSRDLRMAQIDTCIDSVIQQSMKSRDYLDDDVAVSPDTTGLDLSLSEVVTVDDSDSELNSFDLDLSPPKTPSSIPRTPEMPKRDKDLAKDRKRKRERSKSRKLYSPPKKVKLEEEPEVLPDRPKTPEVIQEIRPPVFPFFSHSLYPPAPGLIPPPIGHPFFPRFPLPMGKNMPHPAMPNMALPPALFMHPRAEELPEPPIIKTPETKLPIVPPEIHKPVVVNIPEPIKIEKEEKVEKSQPPSLQASPLLKEKLMEKKKHEHKKEKKEKDKTKKKKDKKDKLKGKERAEKKKIKEEKREKLKIKEKKEKKEKRKEKEREEKLEGSVPKITFRLGPSSPRPPTPDAQSPMPRKITIKPIVKTPEESVEARFSESTSIKREPSPELARMSALITRPPKKSSSSKTASSSISPNIPPLPVPPVTLVPDPIPKIKKPVVKPFTKVRPKSFSHREEMVTKEQLSFYHDNAGNKVWICPACGGQDDGSPMIGCDDCDAWYHWVCVGIQVPPDENEDWYCRVCIVKKQEHVSDKSKKKRKKKVSTP